MNGVRCPQCSLINPTSAVECQQCQFPFTHLPPTAYVSVPATEYEKTVSFAAPPPTMLATPAISPDNETGRKTHMWYRIYCGFMAVMYLMVSGAGLFLMAMSQTPEMRKTPELVIYGTVYTFIGIVMFLPFIIAIFLPRKSWNWIVGIILIALGMTSICFLPFLIPLLIFWIKPETQAYFGRK